MATQTELRTEKNREAVYNKAAQVIINQTAWGKFYGYMRSAAARGEGAIPHKVCLDADGRDVTVYKSDAGKWIGAFLKPAHEMAARDIARKKYGRAFLDMIGFGAFLDYRDQKNAKCIVLYPNQILKPEEKKQTVVSPAVTVKKRAIYNYSFNNY